MKKVDYAPEHDKIDYNMKQLSENIEKLSYLQDQLSFTLREVAYQMRLDAFNESLNQKVDTAITNAPELPRRGDNPLTLVSISPKD